MAKGKIDFTKLSLWDYVIGVSFTLLATLGVTGLELALNIALPSFVASVAGAAIGVAAWFIYLLRRNANAR